MSHYDATQSTDKHPEDFPFPSAVQQNDSALIIQKKENIPVDLPVYIGRVRDQDSDEREDSMSSVGEDDNLFRGQIRQQLQPLNKNVLEETKLHSFQRIQVVEISEVKPLQRSNFNNFSFKTSFFNGNDVNSNPSFGKFKKEVSKDHTSRNLKDIT